MVYGYLEVNISKTYGTPMGKGILSYIIYMSIFLCIYVIFQEGHDPNKNMAFPKRRGKTSVETSGLNHRWSNFPWRAFAGEGHQRSFYGQRVSVMVARVFSRISGAFSIANCEITRGYFEVLFIMGLL